MRHRTRGFSLLEVLISMSLFLVLGSSLVALLSRALDFLDTGTGSTEVQDKARDFFTPFERDAKNVVVERMLEPGTPDVRFQCDVVTFDSDNDGEPDYKAQRLTFVRSTNRESYDSEARKLALGGLEEVMWVAIPEQIPDEKDADLRRLGLLKLYRVEKAPAGGKETLFRLDKASKLANFLEPEENPSAAVQAFMTDVLHFGVSFQGARREWTPFWDSTRSIPTGRSMDFPWHIGPDSLKDARDDISPRVMKLTFVYERTGDDVEQVYLLDDIDEKSAFIKVSDTALLVGANSSYVKVGTEWMRSSGIVERDGTLAISERGARGTTAQSHFAGKQEPVRVGFTLERTILLPSYREDWNTQ